MSEENKLKNITTPTGISVEFHQDKPIVSITTPAKNKVVLSDEDKQITIADQNGNQILMSESGITIKSAKNISFEADQNISLKGNTGVTIQAAGGDVDVRGMNINNHADMQFSADGSMTAQVQGGTELTLKGAMVMIN